MTLQPTRRRSKVWRCLVLPLAFSGASLHHRRFLGQLCLFPLGTCFSVVHPVTSIRLRVLTPSSAPGKLLFVPGVALRRPPPVHDTRTSGGSPTTHLALFAGPDTPNADFTLKHRLPLEPITSAALLDALPRNLNARTPQPGVNTHRTPLGHSQRDRFWLLDSVQCTLDGEAPTGFAGQDSDKVCFGDLFVFVSL
jgi:hypothetical protein